MFLSDFTKLLINVCFNDLCYNIEKIVVGDIEIMFIYAFFLLYIFQLIRD